MTYETRLIDDAEMTTLGEMNDHDERPADCPDRECGDCHACAAEAQRRVLELEAKMERAAAARLRIGEESE